MLSPMPIKAQTERTKWCTTGWDSDRRSKHRLTDDDDDDDYDAAAADGFYDERWHFQSDFSTMPVSTNDVAAHIKETLSNWRTA